MIELAPLGFVYGGNNDARSRALERVLKYRFAQEFLKVGKVEKTFGGQDGREGLDEAQDVVDPDACAVTGSEPLLGVGKKTHGGTLLAVHLRRHVFEQRTHFGKIGKAHALLRLDERNGNARFLQHGAQCEGLFVGVGEYRAAARKFAAGKIRNDALDECFFEVFGRVTHETHRSRVVSYRRQSVCL